jgi:hypothetical protein
MSNEQVGKDRLVPVDGHPAYFVCADGSVYSAKSGRIRRLKPQADQDGYLHVVLSTDSRPHTIKVQRLIAAHFLGPKPDGLVICHNDGDQTNNAATNLRYDTQKSNIADIKAHGTEAPPRGSLNGQARLTEDQVRELRALYAAGGATHRALGLRYGISREQARDIINRKAWRHV